ncbi:MAG: hypothetical protein HYV09_25065 [Deltaproteobacteria bacterium]|nr:hypothetical protein [Deltaproteobacteria bacterium]
MRLWIPLLALTASAPAACGNAAPPPATPGPAASTAPSPTATPALAPLAREDALCGRVCAAQAKCGAPKEPCVRKCLPIARVLQTDVVEAMVACVEKKSPPVCDNTEAGVKVRARLVGECTLEATEIKRAEAGTNVDLFAKAHCDRTQECGVAGVFSKAECMGRARDSVRKTEEAGSGSIALYGALRPSSVDAIVTCIKGSPCDKRSSDAAEELGTCLDAVLASAAEPKP